MILILLGWKFSDKVGVAQKAFWGIGLVAWNAFMFSGLVPEWAWEYLVGSINVLNLASRLPQVYSNFKNGSTGTLSFLTWFLNFVGSAARIFTVMKETQDFAMTMIYVQSTTVNGILVSQILWYWNSGKKEVTQKPVETARPVEKKKNRKKID